MDRIIDSMMDLIAFEICEKPLDEKKSALTDDQQLQLFLLSKQHDLAHLVGDALIKNKLLSNPDIKAKYKSEILTAVFRYERLHHELKRLRTALNEAEIAFIPLKGAVIRQYYPEPWMRTSCDIDILVHEEMINQAAQLIVEKLNYTYQKKYYHDICLISEDNIRLELHYSLEERTETFPFLSECWRYTHPILASEYAFDSDFFLAYQYFHAAKHFLYGGCGIRPFLDLHVLEKQLAFDPPVLEDMLDKIGVKKFAQAMSALSLVWFNGNAHDDMTKQMADFILYGGVYGNSVNQMQIKQTEDKGLFRHLLRRAWLPFELICEKYPSLSSHPYLLPFYQVKRWFQLFSPSSRKRILNEVNTISSLSDKSRTETTLLLKELGLSDYIFHT